MDDKIKTLVEHIILIEDKSGIKINYRKIDVKKVSNKYSNTKIPIYKFEIDDKLISRNNSLQVSYKCLECQRINKVALNNIVRKMNKSIWKCRICKEEDEDKRKTHSKFLKDNNPQTTDYRKPIPIKKTLREIIDVSFQEFDEMDFDYIDKYFTKHLTKEEFDYIKPHIISIQNDKFKKEELDTFEYLPALKCNNQTLFTPMFYDHSRDGFEKPIYLKYKCQKCQNDFVNRDLWIQKNRIKILCKECSFCNETFRIRGDKNILNQRITYQSKLELKFIKFCAEKNIIVVDGQKLNYNWNGKNRKYIVDYYLPDLKMLIELKDDHIWHKKQVENGVWKAKMEAVEKYNLENNTQYLLIFPKNYQSSLDNILKQNKNILQKNIS
jgi:DNA-directed RNA polymerase subunit RPC12/RpoP